MVEIIMTKASSSLKNQRLVSDTETAIYSFSKGDKFLYPFTTILREASKAAQQLMLILPFAYFQVTNTSWYKSIVIRKHKWVSCTGS